MRAVNGSGLINQSADGEPRLDRGTARTRLRSNTLRAEVANTQICIAGRDRLVIVGDETADAISTGWNWRLMTKVRRFINPKTCSWRCRTSGWSRLGSRRYSRLAVCATSERCVIGFIKTT